jgi:hypothetical protein
MSALTGIGSVSDLVAHEPMVAAAREAVREASELVPRIAPEAVEVAADLVASLAVLECCAAEAAFERGRLRRKLCEIASGKAARSGAALDIAVDWRILDADDVAKAKAALDAATAALIPRQRPPAWEVLRRW